MIGIGQLRFPRFRGIKHIIQVELHDDLFVEQWVVPKGTIVKTFVTENFGWVLVPMEVKILKHIFKY